MAQLQIGLGLSMAPGPGVDPLAEARLAEEAGFDYVSASDHLNGKTPSYEPWTLLTAVAAQTTRIRVLTRVLATCRQRARQDHQVRRRPALAGAA